MGSQSVCDGLWRFCVSWDRTRGTRLPSFSAVEPGTFSTSGTLSTDTWQQKWEWRVERFCSHKTRIKVRYTVETAAAEKHACLQWWIEKVQSKCQASPNKKKWHVNSVVHRNRRYKDQKLLYWEEKIFRVAVCNSSVVYSKMHCYRLGGQCGYTQLGVGICAHRYCLK